MPAVLAVDIGGTKLAAAVVDADGGLHGYRTAPTGTSAEAALECAIGLGLAVLADSDKPASITGVGVSTMGITREDRVLLAPTVPGWSELRIPARLRAAFGGRPVTVVNDVKAATLAELTWGTLRGIGQGVYLNLGTGVAAGLVMGGRLVNGAHGAAGEIGYFRPSLAEAGDRDTAPVEERIGGRWAGEAASRELGTQVSVASLVTLARTDERAAAVLDRLLAETGLWAANACVLADPEVLSLGGGFLRSAGLVLPRVREVVERIVPFPPRVVAARFGAEAALAGAGAAALGDSQA